MTLRSGDRLGPYEIIASLGAGGMGEVYRARDPRLERDVALKILHDSDDSRAAALLLREARAASALNHPNICHIYDVGESEHGPWIAMEYVPGAPLDTRIPAGGLPLETVIRIGNHIADALVHAHQQGIVHRDLKTANCVWRSGGEVKVLDFGLAGSTPERLAKELTRSGLADGGPAGTPAYMAPEVIRGQAADELSDLWALGVVLYEMASGSRPYDGSTGYQIASLILTEPPKPLPTTIPGQLAAIIGRLLEKDPALRYRTAGEAGAALSTLREAHGPHATGVAPVSGGGGRATRRRAMARGATAIAALGAVGALAIWWTTRDRPIQLDDIQLLSTFDGSHSAPALAPQGNLIAFVADDAEGVAQVWVKNLSDGTPIQITTGPIAADRPRWHPDGSGVAFARRGQGIWLVPALGGTARRLVEQGSNPNFSRDGRRLTWETATGIWVANADGSEARAVKGVPPRYYSIPRMPAISPDGTAIAFFHPEVGPNGDLWVIPAEGGAARRLTHDLREGSAPVWTRDGERIVFSSARDGSRTLWQVPATGGEPAPLTTGAGEDDSPEISADGTRLVFTNVRNSWQLRIADVTGTERTLLERRSELLFPMFAPNGSRIAFFGRAGRAVAIFTIGRDGSDLRQLTGGTELNHQPRWSHDGNFVFFYQITPEHGLRRVPALGGPSTQEYPWDWVTHNAVQFDSTGQRLVYTRLNPPGQPREQPEAAIVIDVASGREGELPQPLRGPSFSPDGRWVAGTDRGAITICHADGGACRTLARLGSSSPVQWSGDGSRLYFLRGVTPGPVEALWSVRVDGTDEQKHRELGTFRSIDRFFDISANGEVVWAPTSGGRRELWTAVMR